MASIPSNPLERAGLGGFLFLGGRLLIVRHEADIGADHREVGNDLDKLLFLALF
jgi:hypothetical protein